MLVPLEDNMDDYLLPDPATMSPGLIDNIKQHLLFLLHAKICMQRDEEFRATGPAIPGRPCILPWCHEFKQLIEHMMDCQVGLRCGTHHCHFSRVLFTHWRMCQKTSCRVCAPIIFHQTFNQVANENI